MNDYEIPADVREAFIYLFGEDELRENGGDDETIMEAYQGEYASDVDFALKCLTPPATLTKCQSICGTTSITRSMLAIS
jgi:hypothetical protein